MVKHVKLFKRSKTHNGFRFKKGLNVLKQEFDPSPSCVPGGFYYCKESDIKHWIYLYGTGLGWIADVETPPDAKVVKMPTHNKLKADKIILSNFRKFTVGTWVQTLTEKQFLTSLRSTNGIYEGLMNTGECQEWLSSRSEQFYLKALKISYDFFKCIPDSCLTDAICTQFIRGILKDFTIYQYNYTDSFIKCLRYNGLLIKEFSKPTAGMMEIAVKQNTDALHSLNANTLESEIVAFLKKDPNNVKYLPKDCVTPALLNSAFEIQVDDVAGVKVVAKN